MVFNCDCMLFKSKNKENLYQIQNFTLFSQRESHQSLSENRGSQSESNEDPIKAYQKTEVLNQNPMKIPSEPIRKERICQNLTEALGTSWDFRFTIAKQTPPLKKRGEHPFTIVDVTIEGWRDGEMGDGEMERWRDGGIER